MGCTSVKVNILRVSYFREYCSYGTLNIFMWASGVGPGQAIDFMSHVSKEERDSSVRPVFLGLKRPR